MFKINIFRTLLPLMLIAAAGIYLPAQGQASRQNAACVEVGFNYETPPEVETPGRPEGFKLVDLGSSK